jgi:hypothetical protein
MHRLSIISDTADSAEHISRRLGSVFATQTLQRESISDAKPRDAQSLISTLPTVSIFPICAFG